MSHVQRKSATFGAIRYRNNVRQTEPTLACHYLLTEETRIRLEQLYESASGREFVMLPAEEVVKEIEEPGNGKVFCEKHDLTSNHRNLKDSDSEGVG